MLSTLYKPFVAAIVTILASVAGPPLAAAAAVPRAAPPTLPQQVEPLTMQVIAHQDDDLFFMNPDVSQSINAGVPSVTVYLTAGQLTGDGATDAERARNRQRGAQNAYATMAGVADADDSTQKEWVATPWSIGGKSVELYILRDRPQIFLIFFNLHDGSLRNLDTGGTDDSVIPAGGVATTSVHFARADVIRVLTAIMGVYHPTVLRSQDAEPDRRAGFTVDHTDHVSAARFAREAAAASQQAVLEVNYRDYNIADSPINLSAAQVARKTQIMNQYFRYDSAQRDSHSGDNWLSRMYQRWPRGTSWAALGDDGLLQAFLVDNGFAYSFMENPGGVWHGARQLADPKGRLAPGLSVIHNADGKLQLFAYRLTDHRIVTLAQDPDSGDFGDTWLSLGNPNAGLDTEDQIGTPAVAINADGRLQVLVKNGGGGLSSLTQTEAGGAWPSAWADLGGSDLQDGITAVTGAQGRIEVFASTRGVVLHWNQARANDVIRLDTTFRSGVPASPPSATIDRQGRVVVAFRRAGTGTVSVISQLTVGGTTWQEVADVGAPQDANEPAVALSPLGSNGRIMMFSRNPDDGLTVGRQVGSTPSFNQWTNMGGSTLGPPAAVLNDDFRVDLFSVSPNGMSTVRQLNAGPDQGYDDWEDLGL